MDKQDDSHEIFEKIGEYIDNGQKFSLATILKAEGSTPRKAGVRAIISDTGKICGTLGGGAVEAETQRMAVECCKSNNPAVFNVELHGADRDDDAPICGGSMRILVDPAIAKYKPLFEQIARAIQSRIKGIVLTTISRSTEIKLNYQWLQEDSIPADIGFPGYDNIHSCIKKEITGFFTENPQYSTETKEVFVEPLILNPLLVIAGGGHIGQALALQANLVGFDIMVFDDRPEFTDKNLFPKGIHTQCGDISKLLDKISPPKDTYVVIVTRGHKNDAEALEICIKKPFTYIGMIGSKRKVNIIRENFTQSGISSVEEFDRVFSPVGMDIGAVTVPEIAASITAELIAVRRKGIVHKTRNKEGLS